MAIMWKVINSLSCIDLIFGFLVGSENIDSEQTSQMNDSARQSEERISQLTSEQADLKQQLEAQVRDNANLSRSVHLSVSLSFHLSDCLYIYRCITYDFTVCVIDEDLWFQTDGGEGGEDLGS